MESISSFFASNYQTPSWLTKKMSRRTAFKAGAGTFALAALPSFSKVLASSYVNTQLTTEPWLTLDAVLNHLLPESPSLVSTNDISAKTIQATQYLINVVELQPTEPAEIEFIYKGVGWLNSYTQSKTTKNFSLLNDEDKERMLKAISKSGAGYNWINNLIGYIYEAMLSPPIYGGNPLGIGWKWLEHQPGYPLPKTGDRFYELPGYIPISFNGESPNYAMNNVQKTSMNSKRIKA